MGRARAFAGCGLLALIVALAGGVARGEDKGAGTTKTDKAPDKADKTKAVDKGGTSAEKAEKTEKTAEKGKADKGKTDSAAKGASAEKSDAKTPAAESGKQDAKADGDKVAEGEPKADAKPKKAKRSARKRAKGKVGDQESGGGGSAVEGEMASAPPLTMGGLRAEVDAQGTERGLSPGASPRTKLEAVLSEVVKARKGLHEDTERLAAMVANDGEGEGNGATGNGAQRPVDPNAKPPKNPLDVLAKALRGIKPIEAAPIVARLDKRLAANILQRMPPADAGKIMGALKPETAAELATVIASHVDLRHRAGTTPGGPR